jgi:hypothetical protein
VKRYVLVLTGLLALMLAACAPTSQVALNVVPTLISARPLGPSGEVVLQGRYFGGGGEGSHVLVGADVLGEGGTMVTASSWSPNRIEFTAPAGTGPGFVFVVVNGIPSNGLPVDLR